MTTFTGTSGDDIIAPDLVSAGVATDGAPTPGEGRDFIDGGAGGDTLTAGEDDILGGGEGNDLLAGAEGALLYGEAGNDTLSGVLNDVLDGGEGNDVLKVGFSTRAFADVGDDTIVSGVENNGAQISAGEGNDVLFAISGNIEFHGDAGDDQVIWNMSVAQGSNTLLDGGDDNDTITVFVQQDDLGSQISLSNVEGFADLRVMHDDDTDAQLFAQNVEHIVVQASGAGDEIVIEDQTGLGVEQIDIHLGSLEAAAPDGQRDTVRLEATAAEDVVTVFTANGRVVVNGLPEKVVVDQIDGTDQVLVSTGDGDDFIDLTGAKDAALQSVIVVDAGDGIDAIRGSALADNLNGGAGDDTLTGARGDDVIGGGEGDDRSVWSLGDGSDAVDGGAGADQQDVTMGAAGEAVKIGASAGHAIVTVDGAAVLDLDSVETLNVNVLQGGDSVAIGDLSSTAVRAVNVDLTDGAGQPDASGDRVTLIGAATANAITLVQAPDGLMQVINTATGVVTTLTGLNGEDQVIVLGGGDDDLVRLKGAVSNVQLVVQTGDGDDEIFGAIGSVTLSGGAGDDTIHAGGGRNIVSGDEGDDLLISADGAIVLGGAGNDTLEARALDVLNGGDGDDTLSVGASTRADGGAGNDTITAGAGTAGGSQSNGGDGADVFVGTSGNLVFHGDAGDDNAFWNMAGSQGDNTLIDGGAGSDSFTITTPQDDVAWKITLGANTPGSEFELIDLQRQGQEAKLFTQGVEHISFQGSAAGDTITVNDQTGLGVERIDIDLGASASGGPDAHRDSLTLNATSGVDRVVVQTIDGELVVGGIPSLVAVHNLDHGGSVSDSVLLSTGAGDDLIKMFALNDTAFSGVITVDTGAGDDVVIGGGAGFTLLFHAGDLSHDRLDFFRGAGNGGSDHIQLLGGPDHSFDEAVANGHIAQVDADVVITDGAGTFLTLTSTSLNSLSGSDFLF